MVSHPVLAIDHGDSRIGLACTDMLGIAVHPLATVARAQGVEQVAEYIRTKQIAQIVVGLPLLKDGSEGDSAEKARAFMSSLTALFPGLPVAYIDESFTTVDAAAKLHAVGINAKKQKGIIDQAAAMEILHRYLELHDAPPEPPLDMPW